MVKISTYLDCRSKANHNKYPVKIAIRHNYGCKYLPTGIEVQKENWHNGKVIGLKNDKQLNRLLELRLSALNLRLASIENSMNIRQLKVKELAALLDDGIASNEEENADRVTVQSTFSAFIKAKVKSKTKEVYELTNNKVATYCRESLNTEYENILLSDIDYRWLCAFEKWMSDIGNATNTRSIHLRNLRAVFNEAIKRNEIGAELYPFKQFSIKTEQTMKRSLTIHELRKLRDFPAEEHLKKYVDIFLLSFYLAGINMVDLLRLKPLKRGERLTYRRSKTGVLCDLIIPDEAWMIINRYRGNELLLAFGENYTDYKDLVHRVNNGLQRVGDVSYINVVARNGATHPKKVVRPLFPNLTTYWARHTWATIAAVLDIPDAVIDAALGHRSPYRMSEIYIKRNAKKVDAAIRKVIDYVNSNDVVE